MRRGSYWIAILGTTAASALAWSKNPLPRDGRVTRDVLLFNVMAGRPPVTVDFESVPAGSDLSGQTTCGVSLAMKNAPLIVVRADETYTPRGFANVEHPEELALIATSGDQLLSPGGACLAPGPNAAIEDDDVTLIFDPPVAAIGFDHLSQYADGKSYTNVEVIDVNGEYLYSGTIEIGPEIEFVSRRALEPVGEPSSADFWGFVSTAANIREVRIDESDGNDAFPDSNIGIDTLRFAPCRCGSQGDVNGDGLVDCNDLEALMLDMGDYNLKGGGDIRWNPADINRDQTIDSADLLLMMEHFGSM